MWYRLTVLAVGATLWMSVGSSTIQAQGAFGWNGASPYYGPQAGSYGQPLFGRVRSYTFGVPGLGAFGITQIGPGRSSVTTLGWPNGTYSTFGLSLGGLNISRGPVGGYILPPNDPYYGYGYGYGAGQGGAAGYNPYGNPYINPGYGYSQGYSIPGNPNGAPGTAPGAAGYVIPGTPQAPNGWAAAPNGTSWPQSPQAGAAAATPSNGVPAGGQPGNPMTALFPEATQDTSSQLFLRTSSLDARRRSIRLMSQGDEWFQRQNFLQAHARYKQAAAEAMELPEPRFRLGITLCALGEYSQAAQEFKRGLRLDPDWLFQGYHLDRLFTDSNRIARRSMLQKTAAWTQENIRDGERLLVMAVLLHLNGDRSQAHTLFETADLLLGSPDYLRTLGAKNIAPPGKGTPQPGFVPHPPADNPAAPITSAPITASPMTPIRPRGADARGPTVPQPDARTEPLPRALPPTMGRQAPAAQPIPRTNAPPANTPAESAPRSDDRPAADSTDATTLDSEKPAPATDGPLLLPPGAAIAPNRASEGRVADSSTGPTAGRRLSRPTWRLGPQIN